MKRCTTCENGKLERVRIDEAVKVGRRTFTGTVGGERCQSCGTEFLDGADLEAFEDALAASIAAEGPVSGETLRYMRKAGLGMRAADLAKLLDVEPETFSRWENEHAPVPRVEWATVAAMVLERHHGEHGTLDRLRALAEPKPLAKTVRIEHRASTGGR